MRKAPTDSLTRQKLLDAAQRLMLTKGYTATSVEEICATAGLTKGSFFHYFASKEHLGRVVVERYYASWQQLSQSAPFRQKSDPLDRVFGQVDFFLEMCLAPTWKGCMLGTFVQELSQTRPRLRSVCATCFDDLIHNIKQDIEKAKAKYAPRARWSAQSLAEHFIAIAEGATILAKAKQDQKIFETSFGHFKDYLKQIFARQR